MRVSKGIVSVWGSGSGTASAPFQTSFVLSEYAASGTWALTDVWLYDEAGNFAYRVGLPGKSGVGGGIIAVVPGRFTVCVWSPELNAAGNSLAGIAALEKLSERIGWSIF